MSLQIVHITRNPKDVAVSYYHCLILLVSAQNENFKLEWDTFLREVFLEAPCKFMYGSWWDYTEDWIRHIEAHILFIQYEDMVRKPEEMIRRIAGFLGRELSDTQISRIANMVSFDVMKKNENLASSIQKGLLDTTKGSFMRKGKIGDWQNYFTVRQNENFDAIFQDFVRRTGWEQTNQ